jgi:hypothetical protein
LFSCATIASVRLGVGTFFAGSIVIRAVAVVEQTIQRWRYSAALVRKVFDVPEPIYVPLQFPSASIHKNSQPERDNGAL